MVREPLWDRGRCQRPEQAAFLTTLGGALCTGDSHLSQFPIGGVVALAFPVLLPNCFFPDLRKVMDKTMDELTLARACPSEHPPSPGQRWVTAPAAFFWESQN